jgi:hypothetical protein
VLFTIKDTEEMRERERKKCSFHDTGQRKRREERGQNLEPTPEDHRCCIAAAQCRAELGR